MAAQGDLYAMSDELLVRANAALATTPAGAIARALVSIGEPAFDCCPQLSVHWPLVDKDTGSPNAAPFDRMHRLRGGSLNLVTVALTSIRCVPGPREDGQPPSAALLSASAAEVFADGWAMWNVLQRDLKDGLLWEGFPCREITLGPMLPIAPQGNCAGIRLTLSTSLGGYLSS